MGGSHLALIHIAEFGESVLLAAEKRDDVPHLCPRQSFHPVIDDDASDWQPFLAENRPPGSPASEKAPLMPAIRARGPLSQVYWFAWGNSVRSVAFPHGSVPSHKAHAELRATRFDVP